MIITLPQYIGPWHDHADLTMVRMDNAMEWVRRANLLLGMLEAAGVPLYINPYTKSMIAGQTLGGFRPQNATQGAPRSTHKEGHGGDLYDPNNLIDEWLDDHLDVQQELKLWRESPLHTKRWCHLQTVPPGFYTGNANPDRWIFLP